MLVLASLSKLLAQVLSPPAVHTAVLFTATGELVAFAALDAARPKDDVRVLVGLASEVWSETREDGEGMVDSELGRVIVLPVASTPLEGNARPPADPILLIAINATDGVEWGELQLKAHSLATHLVKPLSELQEKFAFPAPSANKGGRR